MVVVTFATRIAGMVRAMVISRSFGASGDVNAFFAALTIPDLIYFLVAGGAARTAFVPVFTEYLAQGKVKQGWRVFSSVFWLLAIVGGIAVVAGSALAPQIARVSAVGWVTSAPERVDLCADLMRILFPAQLFFVLGGLLMGTLNAYKHFFWPAMGPLVYDIIFIVGAVIGGHMPGTSGLEAMAWSAAIGALVGNVLLQVPSLVRRKAKLSPTLDLHDEGVRRVIRLVLPIILGLAVAEVNWAVVRVLATTCGNADAAAILEYSNRIWKLPSGVFAAAIAIAVFPSLSEHYAKGDALSYRRDFSFAMRNTLFMVVPVTVLFGATATPLVRVLYQRGNFDPATSPIIGDVLIWLTPGMVALGIVYICARALYARQDTVTPVIMGVVSILLCVGLGYPASRWMDVGGLAMATSLTNVLNAVLLMWALKRKVGQLEGGRILRSALRMLPGCAALGLICWFGSRALEARLGTEGEVAKLLTLFVPMAAGGLAFLGLCVALRVEELSSAVALVFRRRRGRPQSDPTE